MREENKRMNWLLQPETESVDSTFYNNAGQRQPRPAGLFGWIKALTSVREQYTGRLAL